MKKIALGILISATVLSCSKIEETVTQTVNSAKDKAQQKTSELVQETVNEQLSNLVNAENVTFSNVFPNQSNLVLENEVGKKVAFPNGTPFYVFKYKTADKDLLLNTLVEQATTDEAQSQKEFQKVDGSSIIEKITFFEKFLPANTIDTSFLNDIKNDNSIEYYKIKRFPNASTVIYNPRTQMVYQFVEVKK
ncbi:MAG: hypothetical protein ACXWCA_01020 [Kaistella sp.]